jgi:hypothetical protein
MIFSGEVGMDRSGDANGANWLYQESLTSWRTSLLFIGLTLIFLLMALFTRAGWSVTGWVLSAVFAFYVLNYRKLTLLVDRKRLKLTFGLFSWTVPLENLQDCRLDDALPPFLKYGGAGIHFMTVSGRYRVNFNFLEYPRVVMALKHKAGLVWDVSFSTRRPEELLEVLGSYLAV